MHGDPVKELTLRWVTLWKNLTVCRVEAPDFEITNKAGSANKVNIRCSSGKQSLLKDNIYVLVSRKVFKMIEVIKWL